MKKLILIVLFLFSSLALADLNKVYPNGVKKGHPAYRAALDRDKDGWACERN